VYAELHHQGNKEVPEMNIIVVGGSGFIGTRLVTRLTDSGHKTVIVDKRVSGSFPNHCLQADVRDYEALLTSFRSAFGGERADAVINLAAEHRDDVRPRSLYDEVNVGGARNVCRVCSELGIERQIFTSSVAVYGFAPVGTGEDGVINPFNDYGRTKAEAETIYDEWWRGQTGRSLTVVRPTVVFGENNRGNVYNLLKQMAVGPFLMVGKGRNVKSVAYVENVAAFLEHSLSFTPGKHLYNYIDKPDYSMKELVNHIDMMLRGRPRRMIRIPYVIGYLGGAFLDGVARITGRNFPISAVRVKKFCADTMFSTRKDEADGFTPRFLSMRHGNAP
jgi:nucleoside-diphosphate-sugar epimerase